MSIILSDCSVVDNGKKLLSSINWVAQENETWLITGINGSGKSAFAAALAGAFEIVPSSTGLYSNGYKQTTVLVSFETAASLIEEERKRDDSDYIEGGVDAGRTPRTFIMETLCSDDMHLYPSGLNLELHPAVEKCGIGSVLDRGLKYLSTGEIRRTLLCRALAAKPALIILDDPFEGLDTTSRQKLSSLFTSTQFLFVLDRYSEVPNTVTHVLEIENRTVSFAGTKNEYEARQADRKIVPFSAKKTALAQEEFSDIQKQGSRSLPDTIRTSSEILVEMKNVTVEWSERRVLDNFSWILKRGEHWLIRGPNGSGKTTFLELITGDNPQVFRNDIWLFGNKRGSGETIWELKEKMGIVSYRLHTEYRALGDLDLESVILSGLHDSIGLYQECGEVEHQLAQQWLALAGLSGREAEHFRDISYGEQRAVLIARASVKCPPILILDEPCHGLDDTYRHRILDLLQAIAEGGTSTLLHVTHDPTEVLPCEKHVLEMHPGETPMYQICHI